VRVAPSAAAGGMGGMRANNAAPGGGAQAVVA
jgi:hypothetical protein